MTDRSAYYREYCKKNSERRRENGRLWREANPDYFKNRGTEYFKAYRAANAETIRAKDKERWQRPERKWAPSLWREFGLKLQDFLDLSAAQDNKCAICNRTCRKNTRLSVDHCHSTLAIRGLLCANCNSGLGQFEDRPELLRAAASYLEQEPTPFTVPIRDEKAPEAA